MVPIEPRRKRPPPSAAAPDIVLPFGPVTSTVGVTFMSRGGGGIPPSSDKRGAVVVTLVTGETVTWADAAAGRQFRSPGTRCLLGWGWLEDDATLTAAEDSCDPLAAEDWWLCPARAGRGREGLVVVSDGAIPPVGERREDGDASPLGPMESWLPPRRAATVGTGCAALCAGRLGALVTDVCGAWRVLEIDDCGACPAVAGA